MEKGIFETRDIERALLKLLITQQLTARAYYHRIKEEWFSSTQRKYIFTLGLRVFEDTKSLLTQSLFDFEVNNALGETDRPHYVVEWNVIQGVVAAEHPDALVDGLERAEQANKISGILEEVVDSLDKGNVGEALTTLKRKSVMLGTRHEDKPVSRLTDHEDRKDLIRDKQANPGKYKGVSTGFKLFDSRTGGLFPAELTLLSAITGVGKSTLMKQWELGAILGGKNCLHVTNEENELQVKTKFDALVSLIPYLDFKLATITDEAFEAWDKRILNLRDETRYGQIFVKEIQQFSNVAEIERTIIELQQKGIRIDAIFLDYLDHVMPIQKGWNEHDEQAKATADCKGLAITLNVPVVTATQAATVVEQKQEKGKRFGRLDVYGTKRKVHPANMVIGVIQGDRLHDQLKDNGGDRDYEWQCDVKWSIEVVKNRDGAAFSFDAIHRVRTGLVEPVMCDADGKAISVGGMTKMLEDDMGDDSTSGSGGESEVVESKKSPKKAVKRKKVTKKVE